MYVYTHTHVFIPTIYRMRTIYIGITAGSDAYDQCLNLSAKTISYDNVPVMNYV